MKYKAILKHILDKTIFLASYLLMIVSFFYTIFTLCGIDLCKDRWANFGGFSLITSIVFIRYFYFGKFCRLTRYLPFALFFISIVNILATYFPEQYNIYSAWYEIIIFSVVLSIVFLLWIRKLSSKHGYFITRELK